MKRAHGGWVAVAASIAVAVTGCGSSDSGSGGTGGKAGGGTGGKATGGTGGSAGSAGTGATGGADGGGGLGASGGTTASGGTSGSAGAGAGGGGAGGTGGANGGSGGAAGSSSGGSGGGSGQSVACGATPCALPGNFCCNHPNQPDACVATGGTCTYGVPIACDGPEDCGGGQVCCAELFIQGPNESYVSTACAGSCGGKSQRVVCGATGTCPAGQSCSTSNLLPPYRDCK